MMLKLKLQYFGPLIRRADSFEKTLMLGKIEGRRRSGWQRMRWLDGITDSMDMVLGEFGSWWWIGRPGMLWFMELQRVGHDWVSELNWTEVESPYQVNISTVLVLIRVHSFPWASWRMCVLIFLDIESLVLSLTTACR